MQSKYFNAQETLKNALACREWFLHGDGTEQDLIMHFSAVTASVAKAKEFGVKEQNICPMWGWVGRYSLWLAIGLPLILAIGCEHFREML